MKDDTSDWDALQSKLWDGIDGRDIKLTHADWKMLGFDGEEWGIKPTKDACKVLLAVEEQRRLWRKGKRGGKPNPWLIFRPESIAALKALYEIEGRAPKVAVTDVMKCYGVNRQTVFEACDAFPNARAEHEGMDPVWQRAMIKLYEWQWRPRKRRSANNSPK